MLIPARKLVLATVVCTGGLLSVASVALAGSASSKFDAVGLAGAVPLQDMQMSELRGTGLFGGSLQKFLGALPTGNTVRAQLNQQDEVIRHMDTPLPVSLSCSNGITCPAGTTVNLSANNNIPPGGVVIVVIKHVIITH